ncbi:MAG: molecular chaperone DnaJ, partial [Brevundimonas sp.]
ILGVPADASPEVVQAAWRRLMARAHPDQGGTEGLAARVNAARDRLLKG